MKRKIYVYVTGIRKWLSQNKVYLGLIFLAGIVLWGYTKKAPKPLPQSDKVTVEVVRTQQSDFQNYLKASGILKATEFVHLQSSTTGKIRRIFFSSGEPVTEGEPLIALEDEVLRAELRQAKTRLELAQVERKTTEALYEKGAKPRLAFEKAVAEEKIAEAALALVMANLSQMVIKAPFSGMVGLRNVSVGALVRPGEPVMSVWDTKSIKVDFSVSESDVQFLAVGQTLAVEVDNVSGKLFGARIEALEPVVDEVNHSVLVRGVIDNQNHMLKPGMFARIKVETTLDQNIIMVPESAIVSEGQSESVYVVDAQNKARRKAVVTGSIENGYVEVLEGLESDVFVVVEGTGNLRDGLDVEIVDSSHDDPLDTF